MGKNYHKEDEDCDSEMQPRESKKDSATEALDCFVIQQKIDTFINGYEPLDSMVFGAETFNDVQLRQFFNAYPCSWGDPFKLYMDKLSAAGFRFQISLATREPVMYVRQKFL